MKNIYNQDDKEEILSRINKLKLSSERLWGKMTVNEMLCHCTDQIRIALEKIETKPAGNIFTKTVAKQLVLLGLPAPKGKIKTFPEIDLELGNGTKPKSFDSDKTELINLINELTNAREDFSWPDHSVFGKLSKSQWGRIVYIHLNHHLSQFSV